jgi:hypothetical protein
MSTKHSSTPVPRRRRSTSRGRTGTPIAADRLERLYRTQSVQSDLSEASSGPPPVYREGLGPTLNHLAYATHRNLTLADENDAALREEKRKKAIRAAKKAGAPGKVDMALAQERAQNREYCDAGLAQVFIPEVDQSTPIFEDYQPGDITVAQKVSDSFLKRFKIITHNSRDLNLFIEQVARAAHKHELSFDNVIDIINNQLAEQAAVSWKNNLACYPSLNDAIALFLAQYGSNPSTFEADHSYSTFKIRPNQLIRDAFTLKDLAITAFPGRSAGYIEQLVIDRVHCALEPGILAEMSEVRAQMSTLRARSGKTGSISLAQYLQKLKLCLSRRPQRLPYTVHKIDDSTSTGQPLQMTSNAKSKDSLTGELRQLKSTVQQLSTTQNKQHKAYSTLLSTQSKLLDAVRDFKETSASQTRDLGHYVKMASIQAEDPNPRSRFQYQTPMVTREQRPVRTQNYQRRQYGQRYNMNNYSPRPRYDNSDRADMVFGRFENPTALKACVRSAFADGQGPPHIRLRQFFRDKYSERSSRIGTKMSLKEPSFPQGQSLPYQWQGDKYVPTAPPIDFVIFTMRKQRQHALTRKSLEYFQKYCFLCGCDFCSPNDRRCLYYDVANSSFDPCGICRVGFHKESVCKGIPWQKNTH